MMESERLTSGEIKKLESYLHQMDELMKVQPSGFMYDDDGNMLGDWEAWNKETKDLQDKYHDLIMKCLEMWFKDRMEKGLETSGPRYVGDIVKAILENENAVSLQGFFNMPTSQAIDLPIELLISGSDDENLPSRKRRVSHGTDYEIIREGKSRKYTKQDKNSKLVLKVPDIDILSGNNKSVKKIYVLILQKVNDQAFFNNELWRECVTFSLQELVDKGIFKTIRSARAGFEDAAEKLTPIMMSLNENTTDHKQYRLRPLFKGMDIDQNQCIVYLNDKFYWPSMIRFFTLIPDYYYSLGNRASDLLYYIFYLARQNTKKIKDQGYFNISFRAIQTRLNLPDEMDTDNPKRDIREAIESAIEEIEIANDENFHNSDFTMLPVFDDKPGRLSISDYLNNGYLEIRLKGTIAEKFIQLSKTRQRKIESSEKRKEKIVDQARAINLAKKIEDKS